MAQQEKKTVQCNDAQNFLAAFVRADKKQKNRPGRYDTVRRSPYGIRTLEENKNENLSQTIRKGNGSNERRRQAGSRSDTTACLSAFLLKIISLRYRIHEYSI